MPTLLLSALEQNIYSELKEIARQGGLTTYGDLFAKFGIGDRKFRRRWATILGDISNYTYSKYGRWISALVHNSDTGYAGLGFFSLDGIPPRYQTRGKGLTSEQRHFLDVERRQVWHRDWTHSP